MIGLWWFSTHTRHTDEYLITISITKIVDSSMMMMMTWNSFIHWFSNFFHWIQLCCAFVFIFRKMNLFFHFSMTKSPLFHPTCLLLFVHCKWNEIPLFTRSIESVTLLLLTWINEWISDFFPLFFHRSILFLRPRQWWWNNCDYLSRFLWIYLHYMWSIWWWHHSKFLVRTFHFISLFFIYIIYFCLQTKEKKYWIRYEWFNNSLSTWNLFLIFFFHFSRCKHVYIAIAICSLK